MASPSEQRRVAVVVVGDVGRSPRMQYHAQSFAREGYAVDLIGYVETDVPKALTNMESITVIPLPLPPVWLMLLPSVLRYICKALFTCLMLIRALLTIQKPSFILAQNPPAIPTLPICFICAKFRGVKWLVDWHNYSWSIMALRSQGRTTVLVRILRLVEAMSGRLADGGFCVTMAMQLDLQNKFGISPVSVLHDKPPEHFKRLSVHEKHNLFLKLSLMHNQFASQPDEPHEQNGTRFTRISGSGDSAEPKLNEDRSALIVSSSSWTEDDAVDMLFDAITLYDQQVEASSSSRSPLPDIVLALTGKGPMRCYYEEKARSLTSGLKHVSICFLWLEPEDYPKLLGAADIGICVHNSSSKLDLPMKVIDMFGCELPVLALDYPCLSQELVKSSVNGYVFSTAQQLSGLIVDTLDGFPEKQKSLDNCRSGIRDEYLRAENRWHASWKRTVLPVIDQVMTGRRQSSSAGRQTPESQYY